MAEDSAPEGDPKDLFGEPLPPPRDPRGRRKLRFQSEAYEKVETLKAMGMADGDIATALNITVPTLRKYFFPELKAAVARVKAEVFSAMAAKAKTGNVAAARFVSEQLAIGAAAPPPSRRAKHAPLPEPTAEPEPVAAKEKLGKKAQQARAAQSAHEGTEWGNLLTH